jgi:hypothetical protein
MTSQSIYPELQELRKIADILFYKVKAKKRLYDLYQDVTLEDIAILEEQYKQAEINVQMKRKELGLPYIINEES